ncbi:MAG: DUF1214 domain-containing protein [Novosphingobium sp.]
MIEAAITARNAAVARARSKVLASPWATSETEIAQGLYWIEMLQSFAFNIYMAPRHHLPRFYSHSIFLPYELSFGAPCADFHYRWAFLDGRRTYRIHGRRGTGRWTEFQAQRGFWGDADQTRLANWDFGDFEFPEDGSFEIIASPTRHEGNWMELDPACHNITLLGRDTLYDWANDAPVELHIECVDAPDLGIALSLDEIDRRTRAIGVLTEFTVDFFLGMNEKIAAGGMNCFHQFGVGHADQVGGNPRAQYVHMLYEIAQDEALVIEAAVPHNCRYWSLMLHDPWWQTSEYAAHHSCLNGHQARPDSDGKVRMVIAKDDPGVANWLDPVDNLRGLAQWRWYLSDDAALPVVHKVKTADLPAFLPGSTPRVSPEERAGIIADRKKAIDRRFGF